MALPPASRPALGLLLKAAPLLALLAGCQQPPVKAEPPPWEEAFEASESGWLMNVTVPPGGEPLAVGGRPDAGAIVWREGGTWRPVALGLEGVPLLNWVHGFSPRDIWVTGNAGTLLHWDGTGWTRAEVPTSQALWGVWGAAPDDVWAVGGNGQKAGDATLLHHDGHTWTQVAVPPLQRSRVDAFYKVWGTARDDVWVVGQRGALLHWDGATWTEHSANTSEDLISLWGTGRNQVVAVGGRGNAVVARWDGQAWTSRSLSPLPGLNGVWMRSPGTAHVVGLEGTLATLDVDTLTARPVPPSTRLTFHSVFGEGSGRLFAVGGNLFESSGRYTGIAWTRTLPPSE